MLTFEVDSDVIYEDIKMFAFFITDFPVKVLFEKDIN